MTEKESLLQHIQWIAEEILRNSKSTRVSVKLRTLIRYAYTSSVKNTRDLSALRGMIARVKTPSWATSPFYYRRAARVLQEKLNAKLDRSRSDVYVVLDKHAIKEPGRSEQGREAYMDA